MKAARTVLSVCVVVGVTLSVRLAQAATIPVTCDPDALVAAINTANNNGEADNIILAADCVYTLTGAASENTTNPTGLPEVRSPIEITGNGATIERSNAANIPPFRILWVEENGVLTLQDLTIRNGRTVDGLPQRLLERRNGRAGGGILNNGGSLTLINCTVSGNTTGNGADYDRDEGGEGGEGGGIYNGGGIDKEGLLMLINSTISGNTTGHGGVGFPGGEGGFGGGLSNSNARAGRAGGTVVLINSTISGNTTGNGGGGVTTGKGGPGGNGGGINNHSRLTILNGTITDNAVGKGGVGDAGNGAAGQGGGIRIASSASPLTLRNSIVAAQRRGKDCAGPDPVVYSHTLDSDNSCNPLSPPGAPLPPSLHLGPLQKNGGPTQTHALLCNSPAIDAISISDSSCTGTDQRGVERPQGEACDAGAFEVQAGADLALTQMVSPSLVGIGQPLTYVFTVTNQGPEASTEVTLDSSLPLGEAAVIAVRTSQGQCSAAGALSCNLGALACGQQATVEVELVASASGELMNTAVTHSVFPADPVLDNNTHTEVVCVSALVSLQLPFAVRVVVELLTAPPTVQQAVITGAPPIADGNIVASGCNRELKLQSAGTLLLNAKESQPGCRIILDAEPATKAVDAFPAAAMLTFSDIAGWEHGQIIERYPEVFQITWRPTADAGSQDSLSIVVRLLNPIGAPFLCPVGDPPLCPIRDPSLCPNCNSLDCDGDGLWNDWEQFGVDTDGDGVVNLDLAEKGADPNVPDIFVEIDYMDCGVPGGDCKAGDVHSHELKETARDAVIEAFRNGGVNREMSCNFIRLYIDVDQAIPHVNFLPFASDLGKDFGVVKDQYFGADRRFAYHYGLFIHQLRNGSAQSGQADEPGNDFVVAFGGWNLGGMKDVDDDGLSDADVGTVLQQAGTLMHELGHNLGLRHGGGDSFNRKPNYPSIMNYAFQLTGVTFPAEQLTRLTFSDGQNLTLDEKSLEEEPGLCVGCTAFDTRYVCPYSAACPVPIEDAVATVRTTSSAGLIDWNCNGDPMDTGVTSDLNGDCKNNSTLRDFDDWTNLRMAFQSTNDFARDGTSASGAIEEEIGTVDLNTWFSAAKDSFLRRRVENANEGKNPFLVVQSEINSVVGFDLSHVPSPGVTGAKLRLTVAQTIRHGGAEGFPVQLYLLRGSFTEGNGVTWGNGPRQPEKRGSGSGATWQCAEDTAIETTKTDCDERWNGGEAAIVSLTDSVLHPSDLTTGDIVEWDVTADVQDALAHPEGAPEVVWLLKKERGLGQVVYHSRESALAAGDASLAPSLFLKFD